MKLKKKNVEWPYKNPLEHENLSKLCWKLFPLHAQRAQFAYEMTRDIKFCRPYLFSKRCRVTYYLASRAQDNILGRKNRINDDSEKTTGEPLECYSGSQYTSTFSFLSFFFLFFFFCFSRIAGLFRWNLTRQCIRSSFCLVGVGKGRQT